jgi:hypothetical protein
MRLDRYRVGGYHDLDRNFLGVALGRRPFGYRVI